MLRSILMHEKMCLSYRLESCLKKSKTTRRPWTATSWERNFTEVLLSPSIGEIKMGFLDVAFLSSQASFYTTFLIKHGGGCGLWTSTCHKLLMGVCNGVKNFSPTNHHFVSVEFLKIIRLSQH